MSYQLPDNQGFYGNYGGAFIPEMLHKNVADLEVAFREAIADKLFMDEYHQLLKDYVGRPTPLY